MKYPQDFLTSAESMNHFPGPVLWSGRRGRSRGDIGAEVTIEVSIKVEEKDGADGK